MFLPLLLSVRHLKIKLCPVNSDCSWCCPQIYQLFIQTLPPPPMVTERRAVLTRGSTIQWNQLSLYL